MCKQYGIDAEGLVEHWSSYSMTFLNDAAISLEGLTLMEQRILQKQCTNTQPELTTAKMYPLFGTKMCGTFSITAKEIYVS